MIEVEHLTKRFGDVVAVDDVSFAVGEGEVVGFLGPNGAGKTTTMRVLTSFLPATSGTVRVAGFDPFWESLRTRLRVGYLPESVPLYGEMRVGEYLFHRARLKRVPACLRKRRVAEVLDACGIRSVARRIIGQLSKGYRQRVGLADALVNDPPILILDEPTEGLDPNQVRVVRDMIRNLGQRRTVLLSTHVLSEVEQICPRVVIISDGRIVADDRTERLTRQLDTADRLFVQTVGPGKAIRAALGGIAGVSRVVWEERDGEGGRNGFLVEAAKDAGLREKVLAALREHDWPLLQLAAREPTLEDVFAQRTQTADVAETAGEGAP
ncbi:MAG: ABC transporter ATP-binding protein [bacterium]